MTTEEKLALQIEELIEENERLVDVLNSINDAVFNQDDSSKYYEKIMTKPQLCILLKKDISERYVANICESGLHVDIANYEGEERFVVLLVLHTIDETKDTKIISYWNEPSRQKKTGG